MKKETIENIKVVGCDYFRLEYSLKSQNNLQYYLDKFDVNDYWIYKSTNKFKQVTIEEFYEFKFSGYIFFRKNIFDNKNINEQIKKLYEKITHGIVYFNKPLPSLEYLNKIQRINQII